MPTRLFMLLLLAFTLLSAPLMAQETPSHDGEARSPSEATEKMEESLDRSKPTEDGAKQAPSGNAQPEENWFGCKPDNSEQQASCDDRRDEREEKE
ncbi:hypothetical protein SAMN02745148_02231 [Modicisalibacter ilicicola DSM 19980]|uniref:Uncharacterized protein n=1 Tax=Modicisalibacter ilicicola DSM 19980 TaxID=1121942 RepID=A0A1M5AER0_9GAMM|nr:hypothetical protein [Halomonas ilicicola]SHF28635.1 hypothetical protein SAMN02745148_02231 [Halomonas ilicicola DSM 19980]